MGTAILFTTNLETGQHSGFFVVTKGGDGFTGELISSTAGPYFSDGQMDSIFLNNRALSANEIMDLYLFSEI